MPDARPPHDLETTAFLALQRTAAALMDDVAELLKPSDLSARQYNVLRILRGAGEDGLPCGEIGDRMIARAPDVTRLTDRLEKRSLVRRGRDESDRRVVRVSVSSEGLALLADLDEPIARLHRAQLGALGPKALRTLVALLETVRRD